MNAKPILITAVLSAALLAGCKQGPETSGAAPTAPPPATVTQSNEKPAVTLPAVQGSETPPTAAERKDGGAPVQGQVDTREPAQRGTLEKPKN